MSVEMPPELAWVARLAVGQAWPKGNEDDLHALGQAWHEAAQELKGISGQIGASGNGVLESVGGQVADEFRGFVTQLEASLPEMAESAGQLGKLGKHTAVQVEYAKYMILGQLILLAAQIAEWAFFAPEVIPVAITGARLAVKMILRRLLISVATGVALNVGLDVAVQTIQFLKGDRTEWSTENTVSAVVSGAIGGAMGGLFFGAGSVLAPKFAHSLLGKGILGAATGISTAGIMYGIYHSGEDEFGTSISAGALGALGGGGKRRFGGKGDTFKVDPVHVNVPDALTFDVPGVVSTVKTETAGTDTFKELSDGTTTGGTNATGHAPRAETATATRSGSDTRTTDTGAARTSVVRESTGGASAAHAAQHDGGLPGFTTTLSEAPRQVAMGQSASGTSGSVGRSATPLGAGTATGASAAPRPSGAASAVGGTETGPRAGTSAGAAPLTSGRQTSTPAPSSSAPVDRAAVAVSRPATTGGPDTGPSVTAARPSTEAVGEPAPLGADTTQASRPQTATAAGAVTATASETATAQQTAGAGHPHGGDGPGGDGPVRAPAPRMRLDRTPRIVVRSTFEARRFVYQGEPVTDLTVRIAFRNGGSGHDTEAVWAKVTTGVEQFLNAPKYRLPGQEHRPGAGDRLHVTVVRARPGEEAHLTVDLVGRDGVMDQRRWRANAEPIEYAHELTHQVLGLRDEYRDDAVPHRPHAEGSLLGDFHTDSPDGLARGGLRERHLQLVAAVVGDLRREDPGLPHDTEWEQARLAATPHKRSHTWVDPVSDPSRYEQRDGSARETSTLADPRMLSAGRSDSDESEPESDWEADTYTPPRPGRAAALTPLHSTASAHITDTQQPGNGTHAEEPAPDGRGTPESPNQSEDRSGYTDTAGHETAEEGANIPAPVVPLLEALPPGTFEARTLWGDDSFGTFGVAVRRPAGRIETHPVAYFHEKGGEGTPQNDDLLWAHRVDAYKARAEAAAHRLQLIVERARETVSAKEASDQERARAQKLLKTESAMAEDGWLPEYRSEFLHLQMLMGESDFLDALPRELVVNDRWHVGPEDEPGTTTPWALVDPENPTGSIGGSLRGPDGVSTRFHDWLNGIGGHSDWLADWATDQSSGSITAEALRFKVMMSHFRPAKTPEGFYWHRLDHPDLRNDVVPARSRHEDDTPVTNFHSSYVRSMAAQHVFTHEILTRVKMPNVDPVEGVVHLLRLEKRSLVQESNEGVALEVGKPIKLQRGPAESFSLLAPYKDPKDTVNHTLGPFWVTTQKIPLHQVFGTYLQTRAGELPEHTLFLSETENEFLALSDRAEVVYHGTDTPPPLAVVREASAPHPDEAAPRAPVSGGSGRQTGTSDTHHQTLSGTDATAETPAETPASSSENASSRVVAPAVARSQYGMPEKNFDKFRDVARTKNLVIDVRPTNTAAPKWLDEGKLPKPKDIKAKSINDLDVRLGAKAEHVGLIGYFKPLRPERASLDDRTWEQLEKRFAQRTQEFETLAPVMADLQAQGRFKVENGLVYGRDSQHEWKEITGDHDVFDISTPGGTRLKGDPYHEVVNTMMAGDMAVMHGAHMDWEPSTPFSKGIFSKIVESHQEGGEPLLRFRPDVNDAELVYASREFSFPNPALAEPEPGTAAQQRPPRADSPPPQPQTPQEPQTPQVPEEPRDPAMPLPEPPSVEPLVQQQPSAERLREQTPLADRPADDSSSAEAKAEQPPSVEPTVEQPTSAEVETERPPSAEPPAERPPSVEPPAEHSPSVELPAKHSPSVEPPAEEPPSAEPPAQQPSSAGPPQRLRGRYQRSLAGIRITNAPGPEALRARLLAMLPPAHAEDRQVVQRLDLEFDPATFRARHEEMVNGGHRFQLRLNGVLHDVELTARPAEWRLREEQASDAEKADKGFERSAEAKREAEPKKTSLTTSEAGLDLAPTVIRPDASHPDRLAVITPSVKAGGATHATDTSVKEAVETGTRTSLTGPTDTYVSELTYRVAVIGPDGIRRPDPAREALVGEVIAEVTRPGTDRPDGVPVRWNGWESDGPGRAEGRPLDVTGLSVLHDDVFRRLPREERPDGTAHKDILEFLSPRNVIDGFEHAAGWGLTSKRLDLSDGGHAWLRLTLVPGTSVHEGTVSDKDSFTSKETGEHGAGRTDTASWGLGLNGGGARRVRQSRTTDESTWLTVTGGYSYARSQAHQEKGKQTFSVEHSLERAGTGDLVRTEVEFRVEVLREHLSPGSDGLHEVRPVPDPGPAPGERPRDEENPPARRTGEVIRLRPHPAAPPDAAAHDAASSTADPGGTRHAPDDLRAPLTAQRTAFVDVPGSTELERHITDRLRELAPGILPPPDGAAGRVTPQAMENQRLLRARLSPSGLRADGGRLLDGTFRITLDASHLPGLPGRSYEVVVGADIGAGRHDGAVATTVKNTVSRGHTSEKGVSRGGKHTLGVSGTVRSALNPQDSVRAFGLGGVDGSYAPTRQTVAGGETQAKRTFQHKGQADAFSYPVGYRVLVGPHREGDPPSALPAGPAADGGTPGAVRDVVLTEGDRLRVEVRRPEVSTSVPQFMRPGRLSQLHSVTHVGDEAGFRSQARTALRNAYDSRRADSEPPRVPELADAVDALVGRAQLPGLVSASHVGWVNTLDRHVGDGRHPDTVGLSVRTRLIDLTYQETLSGDGTLDLELKASAATTLADQTSWSLKGNIGPDFGRFPETATGALTTSYQLRGGIRAKAGGQWDDADTVKQQTTTSRKVSHTGTWHVYRATAEVSMAGRITDAAGTPHLGRPVRHDHELLVLVSDEDATLLEIGDAAVATARPPELRATLLDQGISGGVLVNLRDTDLVLREIDQQLRGPNAETVPVAALPFADTYAPDALAARYDELVGPGVLDRHVEVTRAGRVVTEVLVRGVPNEWKDQGFRSDRPLTRDVSAADTVKGKAGGKRSAGLEGNLRAAVRPPVAHLNSASLTPGAAFEGSRGDSAESGVTTTVGHKTSGFGDDHARFTTDLSYEVTVTRRTETGRFVHLPKDPATVGPARVTAWVPLSLTESATAAAHPQVPDDPGRPAPHPAPSANHPFDIELARTDLRRRAEHAAWQNQLGAAHDLVGFDRTRDLHDAAVQVQLTPRRWGDGLLELIGEQYSWALARGSAFGRWAVRSTLPAHLAATVSRFLDTFSADPRLDSRPSFSREQRLTLEEQFAIRQTFSGQSLPALFHRLADEGHVHRVPGTSLALSIEAIGPAEEVSRRDAADDELTVTVKDEAGTTATDAANWTVSPLDFSALTEDPVVTIPLNTGRMTRDQSYDVARPVTRAPGTPGRPTPDTDLPHGRTATEPGKVKVTDPAFLMRQPVRITVRRHDDATGNGAPRFVTGHVFHWSTTPAADPPSAPPPRPSAPAAEHAEHPAPPRPLRAPAAAPRSSGPHADEIAPRAPRSRIGAAGTATAAIDTAIGDHPAAAASAPLTHGVAFDAEDSTTPGPREVAAIDALAAELAREAVRRVAVGLPLPEVLVTGHGTAAVSGQPHFGRAVRLGAERADGVRDVLAHRLDAHLRDLASTLTSEAFTITTESRGPDLPHGTDPAHDTPEARRRATINVIHRPDPGPQPPAPDSRPPVRPEQWRARRAHAVWAVLRTERYDPARDPAADRPAPGLLAGRDVVIRAAIARIQADDGRWVRNLSLHLPVRFGEGFTATDLGAYRERLQTLLDTYVNDGRRLPGSGDQLHIDVELAHRPDHPEAVEISRSERPVRAWDQFTFPLGTHEGIRDDARALHEMLHYAGLPDRYHEATTLFRRLERQSERSGLMADIDTIDVPDTYLRTIAEATDSGPVLRDLPYTGEAKPTVTAPGLTGAAARDALLTADPQTGPAPVRPPAAAPFAGHDQEYVDNLIRRVLHPETEMEHGRNWAGPGRAPLDATSYGVLHADGRRTVHEVPWTDAYIVMARAGEDHITLETPDGKIRLTEAEDFAALLQDDPRLPAHADIVLAVRGLPEDALGLPQAVFRATGRRVWTPSAGTLRMVSSRRDHRKIERFDLIGTDPRWAPTTSEAGPDHFAHLRAEHLLTDQYRVATADDQAVLFRRLPATQYAIFPHGSRPDPDTPALILPMQELEVVPVHASPRIRVSQDRTLAIDGGGLSQHAYATERAVDEANAKLAAAGSKVRLTADPEVTVTFEREDGLPTPPLLRITPEFLTSSKRSEEEACRDFAQMVSGQVRASHVVFRVPEERVATTQVSALDTAEVTGTHHLAESLARVADGALDPAATGPAWAAAQTARDDRGVGGQGGSPTPGREYGSALSYQRVDDPRRYALAQSARRTGINEAAWAQVGEGYLVQSINAADADGKPTLAVNYAKPTRSSASHFGYHFASVVLASEDGQAQITLENHARVSRTRQEMSQAVELNLRSSAARLRALAAALNDRARFAERVEASEEHQNTLKARARLADRLVAAREARDRGAPEEEQERTFQQAATAMLRAAPMIDGKTQWYFRSYSTRPGESMHESHAELLSDHFSAEANPLTLVVLHGHGVSAPEHRFIPFEASGAMADSAGFKLDHLAEQLVRSGLWNLAHDLPLPTVRLTGHSGGTEPHLDLKLTRDMAATIRDELHLRIADLLRRRGSDTAPEAFRIFIGSGLQRHDGRGRGPEVTFEVDDRRATGDDHDSTATS
ncbi:WXG100-like domain-containing protein [Streptomyces sp. NPDC001286]